MKHIKKYIAILLVFVVGVGAFGCGKNEESKGNDDSKSDSKVMEFDMIYTKDDIAEPMEEMVTAFMEEYPNIKANVEMLSSNSDEIIQSRDAAGDLPDIFPVYNLGPDALKSWVDSGKIADISGLKTFQQLPDDIKDMVTTDDGKAYSMILSTTTYGVVYNKDLFKEAGINEIPRTLKDMQTVCKTLQDKGITPFAVGAKDGWTVANQIWRAGLDYIFPKEWNAALYKGEASFMDYGLDMFPFLDTVLANCNDKPLDTDYMTQLSMLAEGEAAMACQGPWAYNNILDMSPEMEDKFGIMPLTFTNEKEKNPMWIMQELGFIVSADANLEAVDTFFDFMINNETGREIFANGFNVMNPFGIEMKGNCVIDDANKYIEEGFIFDYQDNNRPSDFFMVDQVAMQDYIGGKITQEEVLKGMDKSWEEIQAKTK